MLVASMRPLPRAKPGLNPYGCMTYQAKRFRRVRMPVMLPRQRDAPPRSHPRRPSRSCCSARRISVAPVAMCNDDADIAEQPEDVLATIAAAPALEH